MIEVVVEEGDINVAVVSIGNRKEVSRVLLESTNDRESLCPPTSCAKHVISTAKTKHSAMMF